METKNKNIVVTQSKEETEYAKPRMFNVIMYNDDFTTMEFVTEILSVVFHKSDEEANTIMMKIHNSGKAVCGTFTRDIAETKMLIVHGSAIKNEFPLRCEIVPIET